MNIYIICGLKISGKLADELFKFIMNITYEITIFFIKNVYRTRVGKKVSQKGIMFIILINT